MSGPKESEWNFGEKTEISIKRKSTNEGRRKEDGSTRAEGEGRVYHIYLLSYLFSLSLTSSDCLLVEAEEERF